jgi:hypothetical protein
MDQADRMDDAPGYQQRLRKLCERAQQEPDFDRLAQIVEEILRLLAEQQAKGIGAACTPPAKDSK